MKAPALPLFALTCLLSACSSPTAPSVATPYAETGRPIGWAEKLSTAWGELPSYNLKGHSFKGLRPPRGQTLNGQVTLDVLINADGTIEDTSVFASSGNPDLDRAAQARFEKARYTLRLGPDDPAPHVVRLTVAFRSETGSGREPIPTGYQDYKGAGPQPQN